MLDRQTHRLLLFSDLQHIDTRAGYKETINDNVIQAKLRVGSNSLAEFTHQCIRIGKKKILRKTKDRETTVRLCFIVRKFVYWYSTKQLIMTYRICHELTVEIKLY